MSYDIFLMRFKSGVPSPIDAPEFWELLATAWEAPPDEYGFVRLARDQGHADVYVGQADEARESIMINRFGGDEIMDLIVELARVGDLVIIGPGVPPCLTRTDQRVPRDLLDLGDPILVSSGRQLSDVIGRA